MGRCKAKPKHCIAWDRLLRSSLGTLRNLAMHSLACLAGHNVELQHRKQVLAASERVHPGPPLERHPWNRSPKHLEQKLEVLRCRQQAWTMEPELLCWLDGQRLLL
jgi:hypothetical protein